MPNSLACWLPNDQVAMPYDVVHVRCCQTLKSAGAVEDCGRCLTPSWGQSVQTGSKREPRQSPCSVMRGSLSECSALSMVRERVSYCKSKC